MFGNCRGRVYSTKINYLDIRCQLCHPQAESTYVTDQVDEKDVVKVIRKRNSIEMLGHRLTGERAQMEGDKDE